MAARLAGHVEDHRIILDEESTDTLESVIAAARYVHSRRYSGCTLVSDAYHLPRIALMFRILGVPISLGPVEGRSGAPLRHWIYMRARETAALPYDAAITLLRRQSLLAEIRRP